MGHSVSRVVLWGLGNTSSKPQHVPYKQAGRECGRKMAGQVRKLYLQTPAAVGFCSYC